MVISESKQTLEGHYVNLRPLQVEDAELTFGWRRGARAILLNHGAQTVEQQARWIAGRPASEYNFIIETKSHRRIGMVSLSGIDAVNRLGEPGRFLIGDEEGAQGLPAAAEAMKLLYELAFDRLGLRRVWGIVAEDNRRMVKWQTYLGMTREGCLREHLFINGHVQNAIVFGLLVSEYRRTTLPRLESLIAAARLPVASVHPSE
ncbi:MAG: GNAT family N-acetyltransferase [Burkholderiales bacterium]